MLLVDVELETGNVVLPLRETDADAGGVMVLVLATLTVLTLLTLCTLTLLRLALTLDGKRLAVGLGAGELTSVSAAK